MSGRIKVEDHVQWLASMFETQEVHEFLGTIWRGRPELARVPDGQHSSRSNAKYDATGGVLFGIKFKEAVHKDDADGQSKFSHFYDNEILLHMTKDEAIGLAKNLLMAATGSHL